MNAEFTHSDTSTETTMNHQSAALAVAAMLTSAHSFAADHIDEITVNPLGTTAQPSGVLSGEDLLLKRAPTIGETLENELGVTGSYFGPAASRPVIRGQQGPRVKVLSDSVSSLDVADVSVDHAVTIEPVLTDRIEIIRGPSTLLFGSQAAGGIVNIKDGRIPEAQPEGGWDADVEVRGDTASEEKALLGRVNIGLGPLVLHLDGLTRETNDLEIDGFATADPAERPDDEVAGTLLNSASDTDAFAGGLSWVFENGFVGASVSRLENTYGLPGPGEDDGGMEPELFPGSFLDLEQTRVDLRGESRLEGFVEQVRWAVGINDYEHIEFEASGEDGTTFDNEAWQGRVEIVHGEIGGFSGAVGLQVEDRDFSAVGEEAFVDPVTTESWGVFSVERVELGWGQLEIGLRADVLEHEPTGLERYDDTAVSAALGIVAPVADQLEVYGNLARTERHPAAEELYSTGPHLATRQFEIGLLDADPDALGRAEKETSTNIDFGIRGTNGPAQFEAGLFFNATDDYIFQQLTGGIEDDLPIAAYRQADAEFWGIEAEVEFSLAEDSALSPSLRIFGDFTNAELTDGSDLPRIPPLRIGAGASIGQSGWGADLDVIYHDKQDDISSFQTGSFTMVNLGGWYRVPVANGELELFARATNLLDEDARRSTSFLAAFAPLPGASLTGGVRIAF